MPQEKKAFYAAYQKGAEFLYKNRDSTYFYFNKALRLANEQDAMTYVMASHNYLLKANAVYYDLGNYQKNLKAIAYRFKCDDRLINNSYKDHYYNLYLFYKGGYYFKIEEYKKAEHYFLEFYKEQKKTPPNNLSLDYLKSIYATQAWLGNIYSAGHKYSLAKKYFNKNIDFIGRHQKAGFDKSAIALTNLNLARVLEKEGKYKKAEAFIQKSLDFYKSVEESTKFKNSVISAYRVLANNYLMQEKPNDALLILSRMKEKLLGTENLKYVVTYLKYEARAFTQKKDFENALQFYQKALKTTQKYYQTNFHPDIAELHKEIGELYGEQKQFEKSLTHFQKALSALSENFKSKTFFDNPKPKSVLSKLTLTKILAAKQQTLAKAFEHKNNLEFLKAANQTAKSLVKTLDALKPEFEAKVDFQFLLEETFPAFDQMMQTVFLLHQKTGENAYLNDAFYFAEKSKAVLLLSAVQNTNANQFVGVPDSVVVKEQQFRATINHLEKKQFKNPNDKVLQEELFNLKNDFYAFLDQLEIHYPKYHRLKFDSRVADLPETQELLEPKEALLEYYAATDFLYCFLVENGKTRLWQIPLSENFSKKIIHLQKLLSTPSVLKIGELKSLGNELREKIIPELSPKISKLIIARSGLLNYVPFEALYNFKENKYLIENYTVSYANSATLYQEYTKRPVSENHRLLAFAPGFDKFPQSSELEKVELGPLLHNEEEVKKISNYFKGRVLTNKAASLRVFEDSAKKFGILHLATHAIVNDQFPDYSYLAFSPKDSVNLLYIKDLYNYKLNADLVVLSACETGVGKLQKGAGMLSLARGFNYAGANALLTTQWKINDRSAANLMENFYKNLSKGQAKNTALRNAKTQYLKTTDDAMQRHPYYWAGFVLSGNTAPIVETFSRIWWISGVLFFVLIAATIVFWWKRNKCA